jgi:hypothetical protein
MTPPFDDDARDAQPSATLWRCRRCGELETVDVPDVGAELRRAIEHGAALRLHRCDDGEGIADLIGGASHCRTLEELLAAKREREESGLPRILAG